jgi:predicted TIM-barrel fold metal-dependent hydrolase
LPPAEGAGSTVIVDVGGWVAPAMELIYEQGTPEFRGQWRRIESRLELAPLRSGRGDWSHPCLELSAQGYRRPRRDAWALACGALERPIADGVLHDNASGRVAELDRAGISLQLISPGPSLDACLTLPAPLAAGVFAGYNRYILDYCEPFPERLGAVLLLHGSEPTWSAQEVDELGDASCVRAVSICLPVRIAPDERRFDRLWDALERAGLPVLHRPSFCSQIWSPGRLLSYLRGAGVLARHPGLRLGFMAGDGGVVADSRAFAAMRSGQLEHARDPSVAAMWASDFPLAGDLQAELSHAARTLGSAARDVFVLSPQRFLSRGSHG